VRTALVIFVAGLVALLVPSVSNAEFTVQIPDKTIMSGSSAIDSFFDVFFESVTGDPDLAAYMITLRLVGSGGNSGSVEFISPFVANPVNPIFPSNPPLTNTNPYDKSDATTIRAHADLPAGSELIANGKGLMRVLFRVSPMAAGTWDVVCDIDKGAKTSFTDAEGTEYLDGVDYTVDAGRITVVVPEPAALLAGMPLLALVACRRRRDA